MQYTLTEQQRIPTSGARAAKSFELDGQKFLAIPQLAIDVDGEPAGMNAGDSDTDVLVLRLAAHHYEPYAVIPGPGGEDAEFFEIDGRAFLAVACIRTGSGPYDFNTDSLIYEWRNGSFELFQRVSSFAAKQWKHWRIGTRDFLGLAQGLGLPSLRDQNRNSIVFEWNGSSFVEFQVIASQGAYNWYSFAIHDTVFVAHADHAGPSVLYKWQDGSLHPHQSLMPEGGRAFVHFERDDQTYLVTASITDAPQLMRWGGSSFTCVQQLDGAGARELSVVEFHGRLILIRINFITGSPADPEPSLRSQVYEWRDGALCVLAEFPTIGGTDVEILDTDDDAIRFAVSSGLSADVRFASDSVIYCLELPGKDAA